MGLVKYNVLLKIKNMLILRCEENMVNYSGQSQESQEVQKVLQALLQISGSLGRLDIPVETFKLVLDKQDWEYLIRVIEQNKTANFYKFYKREVNDNFFKLGNVKVVCGGV